MPVTDLGDGLPWWLQGPGPTGAPTTQPQGSGGGAQNWLDYLYNMVNPVSSAQADVLHPNLSHPNLSDPLGSSVTMSNAGPPGPMRPPNTMDIAPGTQSSASLGAYNRMPFPGQRDAVGVFAPRPGPQGPPVGAGLPDLSGIPRTPNGVLATAPQPGAAGPGGGVGGPAPAAAPAGPLSSSGGASGMGATSNPRFVQIDSPNLSAAGMGSRGAPQMTALNLGGLFRGGGGASNAPASAAPSGGAARPVPGPLASAPMPPVMPDDLRRQRLQQIAASRSGFA